MSLARTPQQAGDFTGVQLPVSGIRQRLRLIGRKDALRPGTVQRVWLVEYLAFRADPALGPGWRVAGRWRANPFVLVLYEREQAPSPAGADHTGG